MKHRILYWIGKQFDRFGCALQKSGERLCWCGVALGKRNCDCVQCVERRKRNV